VLRKGMKEEIEDLIRQGGVFGLHLRQLPRFKCGCFDPTTKSTNPRCPHCFGLGVRTRLEIVRGVYGGRGTLLGLARALDEIRPGIVDEHSELWALPLPAFPQTNDKIFRCEWKIVSGVPVYPVSVLSVLEVNFTYLVRDPFMEPGEDNRVCWVVAGHVETQYFESWVKTILRKNPAEFIRRKELILE